MRKVNVTAKYESTETQEIQLVKTKSIPALMCTATDVTNHLLLTPSLMTVIMNLSVMSALSMYRWLCYVRL